MTAHKNTVAVIGTGDMGHAVGGALVRAGHRVVTAGAGRSELTRRLATEARIEDVGSLEAAVAAAGLVLSIVPPAAATTFAADAAGAMRTAGARPVFAECNAISPATAQSIERVLRMTGAPFVDVGIVGRGPAVGRERTRIYASGEARAAVLELRSDELELIDLGPQIGRASAMKMAYSALNKGTDALLTAVLLAAARLDVLEPLLRELRFSQVEALERMQARVPFLGATAKRYAPEMAEIARTYESAGVTPQFHRAAEWLYALYAETPFAAESRATQPHERSLGEALEVLTAALERRVGP